MIYIGGDINIDLDKYLDDIPRTDKDEDRNLINIRVLPQGYYPLVALNMGERVSENPTYNKGILICKTGIGMDMLVNKFKGIRAVIGITKEVIIAARRRQDANVLCYGINTCTIPLREAVEVFLNTPKEFSPNQELFNLIEEEICQRK